MFAKQPVISVEDGVTRDYHPILRVDGERLPAKKPVEDRVLVRAQNVHDYYLAHYKEHGWDNLSSFTCAKPPFQHMVITYDHPFYARHRERRGPKEEFVRLEHPENAGPKDEMIVRHMDLVVTEQTPEYFAHYLTDEVVEGYDPKLISEHRAELRRIVQAINPHCFVEIRIASDLMQWPGRWFVMLDATGAVQVHENYGYVFIRDPKETEILQTHDLDGEVTGAFTKHGAIALATLQFMNCKNVEIIENAPTRQQRRQAEREGKKPPVTYKTLRIVPLDPVKRYARGAAPEAMSEVSLHICRGHFKDFREGPGLGKGHAHGLWWWQAQVRGKSERGRVVKDYEVSGV